MKTLFSLLFLLVASTAFSQKSDWKEMHDFHGVISKTFHPAEEGNLQPVKDSSAALLSAAKKWQSSKVPAGYDAEVASPILKKLVTDCEEVGKAVKANQSDEELKKLITRTHDTFHEIMEKCREQKH